MKSNLISILFSTVSLLALGPIGSIRNRMANIVALIDPIKVAAGWLTDVDTTAKQFSRHWRHALREDITTTISTFLQEWVPEDTHVSISQRWWSLCYVLKHFSVLVNPRHNTTLYQISIPQMPAITRLIQHMYVKELCSTFHSTVFSIHFLCMWEFPPIPSTLVVGCHR